MRIYLVQHGQAKSKEEDPDRHLTDLGRKDVEKVATFLKSLNVTAEALYHGGKPRATQTAEILSTAVSSKQGAVQHDGLAPKDDVKPIVDEISQLNKDIFIVGHLPFLSKLASQLICGETDSTVVKFQYAGVVCLEQTEDTPWSARWMLIPELV